MFYKLNQDGYIICQSCMNAGYWKDALEIIEHNKQAEFVRGKRVNLSVLDDYCRVPQEIIEEIVDEVCNKNDEIAQIIHCSSTNEWAKDYMETKQLKT